jgi:hypothetical protein
VTHVFAANFSVENCVTRFSRQFFGRKLSQVTPAIFFGQELVKPIIGRPFARRPSTVGEMRGRASPGTDFTKLVFGRKFFGQCFLNQPIVVKNVMLKARDNHRP